MRYCCFIFIILGGLFSAPLIIAGTTANASEAGLPFIKNYHPNEYGSAHAQNWAITQNSRELMYFGNNLGVLEYDGVSWRLIPTKKETIVRGLAVHNDIIYAGARGEFGYLAPDSLGGLRYVSLLDYLPPDSESLTEILEIHTTSESVFFRTIKAVLRWTPDSNYRSTGTDAHQKLTGRLTVFRPHTSFYRLFACDHTVFVVQPDHGLMHLVDGKFKLVPEGERFAKKPVRFILKLPQTQLQQKNTFLIGTRNDGFFLFDHESITPFEMEPAVKKFASEMRLTTATMLPDNSIALGSYQGGVAVIDRFGKLQFILNKSSGLQNENVRAMFSDRQGGLWLGLNNGITRVEYPAPFTFFDPKSGLEGNIIHIRKHNGRLYTAGSRGVHQLEQDSASAKPLHFQQLSGSSNAWTIVPGQDELLVGARYGIYQVEQNHMRKIIDLGVFSLLQSKFRQDIIFAGFKEGLSILIKQNGQWQLAGQIAGVDTEVRTIIEEKPGLVWTGNMLGGVSKVVIPDFDSLQFGTITAEVPAQVSHYHDSHGVPNSTGRVSLVNGRPVFGTNYGLRRYDAKADMFFPDSSLGHQFADSTYMVSWIVEDKHNRVWLKNSHDNYRETGVALPTGNGDYEWDSTPFRRIADWGSVYALYPDEDVDDILWIGGPTGVLRYDHSVKKNYQVDFPALIRRVSVNTDSVIFNGIPLFAEGATLPALAYSDNNLRFQFAAPRFEMPEKTQYQFYLEGFDKNWSAWTSESQKDYTNIPEGNYAFRVRAKDVYQHLSSEDSYAFKVMAPWYRSWWAYAAYLISTVSGIFLLVLWREQRLKKHAHRLEGIIAERTAELADKNEKLLELDTLKSRFFANISHEFRTPLTLILGLIENLHTRLTAHRDKNDLQLLQNNAQRLQRLIGQLLDLSKFEAGQMLLRASGQNIVPLIRTLTDTFTTLARQKQVTLQFESQQENITLYFERDKIEKVMYNLLSNAIKFTPAGGRILVQVEFEGTTEIAGADESGQQGEVKITVRDSGIGIPQDRLPHIFDRFFQVDSSSTREHEGTGIGLALTRELVQLHSGSISVESSEGRGATFEVRLPRGTSHLTEEQMQPATEATDMQSGPVFDAIAHMEQADAQSADSAVAAPKSNKEKEEIILIAEDNRDMRAYLRDNLPAHYQVIEAANGEEALSLATEHIPDLIITDVMMPKMDGYDLTRKLRENQITSHIPIIMLTAKAAETDRFAGLETGADAYLTKPFSTDELRIRVRKLIELRQLLLARVRQQPVIRVAEIMVTSVEQKFLRRLQEIVEDNIDDEYFQIDELCQGIGMSRRQLYRKLNALLNCTPAFYLKQIRLERARQLLEKNAGNITEVAFQVGFSNVSSFSRAFREAFKHSPSELLPK